MLLKTSINEIAGNIYSFLNNSMLLNTDDIREAVKMLNPNITITRDGCMEIINFIIDDESI